MKRATQKRKSPPEMIEIQAKAKEREVNDGKICKTEKGGNFYFSQFVLALEHPFALSPFHIISFTLDQS